MLKSQNFKPAENKDENEKKNGEIIPMNISI